MVRDISGLGSPNRNELRTERKDDNSPKTDKSNSSAVDNSASKAAVSDQVNLSNQAQTLKSLESKLADLPEVDEERVATIKAAIANGEYSINNDKIAEKLLASDALFGK
ncbi:flagellar biosynthesis anti-sigma factor FlgM [Dasania sp. GY-MA-18]|uniref:Negative regulator of flagellin synthesis n=1 Tax=Dasania phycosphaerae TaxID=2950436 RepID=A0A9J6RHM2_9GAMM|nr:MULTISPECIES: flagellar biosynthesis anti-sigma factor FlgM [Dasania]MCR8921405.1 flagellar biosynthesis anti-sigma factor FlgM [Dasania sp. GY-MA-18]MCZ0863833.1 flagellar biosynthesis anti-sigma factor FlgM [Dasania phycosphaerae]MCZ0867561.1 flagellar biosynthesis anti-sigma factor FlgM [Dasania phycosphaerae]